MTLDGRHLLITGAGKRVGRRIAELFLERGKNLKLSAHYFHSRGDAEALAAWGKSRGHSVATVAADLANVGQIRAAVHDAVNRFGPVDILVNSASDFFRSPALEVTEEQWDRLLTVNLKGQFFMAQAVGERMCDRGGVIVNIGDVNGERARKNFAPYCASKAALLNLTRSLAKEWAPKVRVNSVSPGPVLPPANYTEAQRTVAAEVTLLKRWGTPDDIANGCLFLVENDYMTGYDLKVDGGRSIA